MFGWMRGVNETAGENVNAHHGQKPIARPSAQTGVCQKTSNKPPRPPQARRMIEAIARKKVNTILHLAHNAETDVEEDKFESIHC